MPTNRTQWSDVSGMTVEAAAALPIHELYLLKQDLHDHVRALKLREAFLATILQAKYDINANAFGTVRNPDGDYDVVVTVPKNTSWDQDKLQGVSEALANMGEDPHEYIDVKATVSETKYKSWPSSLQKMFEPARTVKPGKPKITIEAKAQEAA